MGLYSQNDEDEVILKYFKENHKSLIGMFMDIGANDGITFSNTMALSKEGWGGVYIEPDKGAFDALVKNTPTKNWKINAAISYKTGEFYFNASKDSLLSTLKDELIPRWSHLTTFTKTKVRCYSWDDLLGLLRVNFKSWSDFRFLSIDAEGMDWIILQQIDLTELLCLCIEYGDNEEEITEYCSSFGMKTIYKSAENLIFVK